MPDARNQKRLCGRRALFLPLYLLFLLPGANCQPAASTGITQNRVIALQQSLVSTESPEGQAARRQLKAILAAPEFSEKTRQPTAWERLEQQIGALFLKNFAALIQSIAQHPTTSKAIFWIAALGALALIAFQLFRLFRRDEVQKTLPSKTEIQEPKNSAAWLAAAKVAAERGEFSEGIQCSYWAAIACLQSKGVLPQAGAYTPREFLRAMRMANATENLRSVTSYLERFWYGRRPATQEDFVECMRSVEEIGCRLD